jgi:hypothetical protein
MKLMSLVGRFEIKKKHERRRKQKGSNLGCSNSEIRRVIQVMENNLCMIRL